ncbi:MAG: GNAT family N-acetyltransferase [Acidobacteria bacterium]|nr:GNAT family N-acetyltransferase [Acidobacteriota bacterium]
MRIRKVRLEDVPPAVELARRLDLDYPGMELDRLWVAEEAGGIAGLVALKEHPDCLELCGLGVEPRFRGKNVGTDLVEAVMAAAPSRVHLATIIPEFFEACGFEKSADIPATFLDKRNTAWCDGCPQERCTVMSREKR